MNKKVISVLVAVTSFVLVFVQISSAQEQEEEYKIEEMVVTGTRTESLLKDTPVRTEIVTMDEIETSGAKNLYEVLDKGLIPGVWVETSCTNCNFSSIRMQGLESGYTLVLIDGQPIFSALAGVYGLRQITPVNIERIEVVKGASSALYGSSALGGVINIITKEPTKDKPMLHASASYGDYNTYDAGGTVSVRKGNLAGIVTAQKHENDYVDETGPDGEPDGYTDKVEQNNDYMSVKTHYYFMDDKQRITLFGRSLHEFRKGGKIAGWPDDPTTPEDESTRGIEDPMDPDAEHITTDRKEYGLGYRGIFSAGNILELNFINTGHERLATNEERPFFSEETIYLWDAIYSHPLFKESHILTMGANYKDEKLDQIINWDVQDPLSSETTGLFIQDEIKLAGGFTLVPGVRYDDVDSTLASDSAVSPRLAAKIDATEDLTFRASVGKGFRVPYLFAEDLHICSAAPLIYVYPGLTPEESWSYSAGLAYIRDRFVLDLNIFRTDIKDKIALLEEDPDKPAGFDFIYKNAGDAYTQGIELSSRIMLLRQLNLNLSFTYTDAMYKEKQDPELEDSDHILRVPEYTARLGVEYYDPGFLRINVGGRYIGQQYLERVMIDVDPAGVTFIDHVDGYTVWDAKVTKYFQDETIAVFLGADNIFEEIQDPLYNAEQEDSAAYIYAPTTGRYIYGGMEVRF
jgi:outer membrane receptor for ferrienterochelin and colicins